MSADDYYVREIYGPGLCDTIKAYLARLRSNLPSFRSVIFFQMRDDSGKLEAGFNVCICVREVCDLNGDIQFINSSI